MKFPTLLAALGLSALSGCTSILGSLLVSDPAISDVDALSQVTSVEEHLLIHDNISLLQVDGLQAMQVIGDTLDLHGNGSMVNIEALAGLDEIGTVDITQTKRSCGAALWPTGS